MTSSKDVPDRQFVRSSYCEASGCVEVSITEEEREVVVRNSQNTPVEVHFSYVEWQAFVNGVRAGEFDVPRR